MSRDEDMRALQAAMLKALPDNSFEARTTVALLVAQFFVVHRAIVADCANAAGVTVEEIRDPSRVARLVRPRQAAMQRVVETGYNLAV